METAFATARTFLVVWCLFCYATTTSFAQQESIATGGVAGEEGITRSEVVVSHTTTTTTTKQEEKEGLHGDHGLLLHPKAPPRPRMEDTPPDSTRLSLQLDDGFEWVVVIKTDIPEAEVRARGTEKRKRKKSIRRLCLHATGKSLYCRLWCSDYAKKSDRRAAKLLASLRWLLTLLYSRG